MCKKSSLPIYQSENQINSGLTLYHLINEASVIASKLDSFKSLGNVYFLQIITFLKCKHFWFKWFLGLIYINCKTLILDDTEKVYFRSQILERPSIGEYWNISGVPVLPENVIFTSFRMCWCHSEAYNTGTQKWFSIVQYSCTSIWDLKFTFSDDTVCRINARQLR